MRNIYTLFLLFVGFSLPMLLNAQNMPCSALNMPFSSQDCAGTVSSSLDLGGASASGMGNPGSCGSGVYSSNAQDYWMMVTIPPGESAVEFNMSWSSCGIFCVSNPGWAVYEAVGGSCSNLVPLGCGGDDGLFPSSSFEVTVNDLEEGDVVYVRVWETDNQNSDFNITASIVPPNDECANALPLQGTGCNYNASNDNEPDSWTPQTCNGTDVWSSNENAIWYTFTVDATTPQPISLEILNVVCDNTGGAVMQLGLWSNTGTCNLGAETFYGCALGTGTVVVGPTNLPLGDYYAFVDGSAGANCTWEFASDEILPIELGELKGTLIGQKSFLEWDTYTETDNKYFDIQHSTDGVDFVSVGNVPGVGNSTVRQEYRFWHNSPAKGENYYRIQQFDYDGQTSLSQTIVLTLNSPRVTGIYPNPLVGNTISLDVEGFSSGDANFKIFDAAGRLVSIESFDYQGEPTLTFDLPNLSKGLYIYSVTVNEIGYTGKLTK